GEGRVEALEENGSLRRGVVPPIPRAEQLARRREREMRNRHREDRVGLTRAEVALDELHVLELEALAVREELPDARGARVAHREVHRERALRRVPFVVGGDEEALGRIVDAGEKRGVGETAPERVLFPRGKRVKARRLPERQEPGLLIADRAV